jgi:hemoglobin
MRDIQTYEDMLHIVTAFYEKLMVDPIIGFFFTDVAKINLPEHLPKVAHFWAFQILGEKGYRADVFNVHLQLHNQSAMTEDHFHRWVFFLVSTIDLLYAGPNAELMKWKAEAIAKKMSYALNIRGEEQPDILGVQEVPSTQHYAPYQS